MELHIGRGSTRGALTVFPLWGAVSVPRGYSTSAASLEVSELREGPQVAGLTATNRDDLPVLVLEGQLFEGGWQHRMACVSTMVGARQRTTLHVACVERGRWGGESRQHSRGRRTTPYIRDAARREESIQGEVWQRVARHTAGTDNPTESFVSHLDAGASRVGQAPVLPGQVGVLVGLGGQPYVAEVFDSALTLRHQLDDILDTAARDARFAPDAATPARRARRFIGRFDTLALEAVGEAGAGERVVGRSEHLDVAALRWAGRDVHTRISNVRHSLLVGA